MKKYIKIISTILLIFLTIFIISSNIYAVACSYCNGLGKIPGTDQVCPVCHGVKTGNINTNKFKPSGLTEDDYGEAFNIASTIVGTLTTVGVIVAVVGIIILGLKYMMGSVEQKAEYKKTMIPYLVGCIFIFCISTIVSIIYKLASQL